MEIDVEMKQVKEDDAGNNTVIVTKNFRKVKYVWYSETRLIITGEDKIEHKFLRNQIERIFVSE